MPIKVCERKYFFTDEMNDTLKAMWEANIPDRIRVLSENWEMPKHAIVSQVRKLGLQRSRSLTKEEKQIIIANSQLPVNKIKEILRKKGYKRRWDTIGNFLYNYRRYLDDTQYYTIDDLMDGFGVTRRVIDGWITRGYLISDFDGRKLQFKYEDIRKFIKNYYNAIDFAKIEEEGFKTWFMEFLITDGQRVPSPRDVVDEIEKDIEFSNN